MLKAYIVTMEQSTMDELEPPATEGTLETSGEPESVAKQDENNKSPPEKESLDLKNLTKSNILQNNTRDEQNSNI